MRIRHSIPKAALAVALTSIVGCNKGTNEAPPVAETAVQPAEPVAAEADVSPPPAEQMADTPAVPVPDEPVVADAPPTPAPSYAVAEWGVLVYPASGPGELVSAPLAAAPVVVPAPAKPEQPAVVPAPDVTAPHDSPPVQRKPVIYLRPDAAWDLATDITVTATMVGLGRLHEVWPTTAGGAQPAHGASFSWKIDSLTRESCAAGWGPKVTDAPCSSLGRPDACEAAEFEAWVPESAACLDVGGVPAPALLYNGFPADPKAPVVAAAEAAGAFKNVSGQPLGLVLVQDAAAGIVRVYAGVAADGTFNGGDLAAAGVEPLAAVAAELTKRGLTTMEAADFMRAWTPLLQDAKGWTVFGFLEQAAIETLSTLSFEPAPSTITRVMAFAVVP